tara:strand:+ start:762 stop:1061 length:300 start_codon:yes stop_codon:yes gene_type:complete
MNYQVHKPKDNSDTYTIKIDWDSNDKKKDLPPYIQIKQKRINELTERHCPNYRDKRFTLDEHEESMLFIKVCDDISEDIMNGYKCKINGFSVVDMDDTN